MTRVSKCWCGNTNLSFFSPSYLKCSACETLILANVPEANGLRVIDDQHDFYGRRYWFSHQKEDLQQPDIIERARRDLPERCIHWLHTVFKYKLPPTRILELGSAHGGFIALLRWSGFEATGLELSPWVVEFAKKTFGIPMLLGSVEDQQLEPSSLDMIILMDVLEHLPDPETLIRRCLDLLKMDGIFVIQTPCLPEGKTYEQMIIQGDRFLDQLKAEEHLYLFSQSSIREFFQRLGTNHLEFEPAIFAHYDMFLVASRAPLNLNSPEKIEKVLNASPSGRMVQALSDLYTQKQQLLKKYNESEADRAARLEVINRLTRVQPIIRMIFSNRVFQILQKLGLLGRMEYKTSQALASANFEKQEDSPEKVSNFSSTAGLNISRIAIDLIPLLPGGENGGAKLLAVELVRNLSKLLPYGEFVLLTSDISHDELSILDSPNVRRLCVRHQKTMIVSPISPRLIRRIRVRLREWLSVSLPPPLLAWGKSAYRSWWSPRRPSSRIIEELGVDLIFCPFTMPFFDTPAIPVVSVIYDLQYLYYPQFFTNEEAFTREKNFKETCRLVDRLICTSEFVRETLLKNSDFLAEHVVSIPVQLFGRLKKPTLDAVSAVLQRHGLEENEFLLYPANFRPHKNHPMLLTAFGMFRSRHPESKLRLVCTGSPDDRMAALQEATRRMGMERWVYFTGFFSEEEFAAVSASCKALIFPSLYEGFGMPVLEAMVFGKPVLCSNVTSLPEIAGDAALYFDPNKPTDILSAIEDILQKPELVNGLINRGYERTASLGDAGQMAQEYLRIFHDVVKGDRRIPADLHGVYSDGWTRERVTVNYDARPASSFLEMVFELPRVQPHKRVSIKVSDGKTQSKNYALRRGHSLSIRHPLEKKGGVVELFFNPTFQPKKCGVNDDERWLGCLCRECAILSGSKRESLLKRSSSSDPV